MKTIILLLMSAILISSCRPPDPDVDEIKNEIFQTEKAFERMAGEKSISEAFYNFAADSAVIKRENDTLIMGKDNIRMYYIKNDNENTTVNWTPDYIDVADDGSLAYTYGKYVWKIKDSKDSITEYKGVFHTVWKKQDDGTWKYVWD